MTHLEPNQSTMNHSAYIRKGVILAAGTGSRMDKLVSLQSIKPLVLLHGKPLIIRAINSLEKAGCDTIVVVLGHEGQVIEKEVRNIYHGPTQLIFAFNKRHDLQNGVSVLAAREHIESDFLLIMSDHLFDDKIMLLISKHCPPNNGAVLCVDYKINKIFDLDDATKVQEKSGLIKRIGKTISEYNCIDTGAFIGTHGLFDALEDIYLKKGDVSLSEGVQVLAHNGKMAVLDIKDAFWQDIDTPEMLSHAEKLLGKSFNHDVDPLT